MKFEDISRLADLVKTSGLSEIEIEENGVRLRISNGEVKPPRPELSPVPSRPVCTHDYVVPEPVETIGGLVRRGDDGDDFFFIKSPMVGTFYGAPAPDVPNFVEVNAEIEPTTVICIIEAMKVMNEIQADVKGIIVDVLVKNGQAVEYGQPLFKVKKP